MIKLVILFSKPAERLRDFEIRYNELLGLLERMPNVQRRQVASIFGSPTGPSPFYRILEVYFEDRDQMQAAMLSPIGQEAGAHIAQFPEGTFDVIFADVYEEAGGTTGSDD